MIKSIISLVLMIASAGLSIKHGWDAFRPASADQAKMMAALGITPTMMPYVGIFSVMVGILLIFPQTFFTGNVLNAITIVLDHGTIVKGGKLSNGINRDSFFNDTAVIDLAEISL